MRDGSPSTRKLPAASGTKKPCGSETDISTPLERPALVSLRHCLHQKRERPSETYSTGIAALVVSKAHHDKIVRWDDQCGLAPCACHVICVPRYRKRSVTVDPEEAAVDRALVGLPCGRKCAYKLDVPFRENLLAIPNAILKIQISKTCPVASGSQFVALPEKVSKRIRFHHHSVDTELVEERPLRKRQIFLPTLFHAEAYQIVDQYRIGVVIASDRVRWPLQRSRRSVVKGIDAASIKVQMIRIRT